ncbi:MAG: DUF885 domain-containing protein [Candidatus Eisenbacteria bacterium]
MKRLLIGLFALILIAGAAFVVPTWWFQPWAVDHFYARVFLKYALRHPEMLTQLGILNSVPIGDWRDRLDDYSPAGEQAEMAFAKENLARLRKYDRARMKPDEQLSYDVMHDFIQLAVEGEKFRFHNYPANQLFGFQSNLPDFLISTQPLKTPRDAESFLRRLSATGVAFDHTIERLRLREERGILPPRFVLRAVINEMEGFAAKPLDENPVVAHFATAVDSLKDMDGARRDALRARVRTGVEQTLLPAYRRMLAFLKEQETRATDDDGVWKLPDGDAYYDFALRTFTTTRLPADTIHQLGKSEVARLQRQMTPLLDRARVPGAAFAGRMQTMRKDPAFGYPPGDSGRAMIIARYEDILEDASRRSDSLFAVRPKGALKVERVPPFKEAGSAGAYYNTGAFDGSRPGVFYANLRDPAETRRPDMRTLAYHEGIPGHHFQLTIAQELKGLPFFRKVIPFTAYAEGWGLYAERLALEHGFHQDAFDSLGAMQAELFRAVRLVVDTGIHRKRWTRQQAIDYMLANTGMDTAGVVTEIERYIVIPGQACAYKVGQLQILALRRRAMDRLGDRFDLKDFHDVVLKQGSLPLTLLERVVEDWIAREEKSSPGQRKG